MAFAMEFYSMIVVFVFVFVGTVHIVIRIMRGIIMSVSGINVTMVNITPVVRVAAINFIVSGVSAPIGMDFFPVMKASQSNRVANDPDVARSQIIVLTADDADKFDTVPNIIIGIYLRSYRNWRRSRLDYHRRRRRWWRGYTDANSH
jgi:hypothetical protein